jgi:hypothetical protein
VILKKDGLPLGIIISIESDSPMQLKISRKILQSVYHTTYQYNVAELIIIIATVVRYPYYD